jgi:protein-disulfide isomerase
MAKTKKKESKDEVVINLDNVGVPIAIIVSGIIIAAVIFLASRNSAPVAEDVAGEVTAPVAEEGADEFTEGSVTLGDGAILGDPDTATVAIVEFSDYQCGFCQRHAEETFPSIKEN